MRGDILVLLLVAVPALASLLLLLLRGSAARRIVVTAVSAAMIVCAVLLCVSVLTQGKLQIASEGLQEVSWLITAIDVVVVVVILYFGFKLREWKIIVPSLLQACGLIYVEVLHRPAEPALLVNIDNLGLVLVMISSIIGPLIAFFALGYMEVHEKHKPEVKPRQPMFFATVFLFLFAMNAMCMSDNMLHFYAFWEITTLCSFLLIGYDGNADSQKSARLALWLNSLGGLFLIAGIVVAAASVGTVSISGLIATHAGAVLLAGVMLFCCAGFVKSAQMPFQPWLLGAMVAPTPVSALLHSSTMVKAGVYLVLRFSPVFGGKTTGALVALVGAFTFMAASALAIGQSNGKRVLAYSTIANLGLIISCAGIGGEVATAAAILLIIYHAVSKALLFLCMGTVEQGIGSRDIEDMFGIFSKMPFTTVIMALGMISMMLPPFGVLLTKWIAIEAAVYLPPVLFCIILGSAFTIVFWVKWLGATLTVYRPEKARLEKLPLPMRFTLAAIGLMIPVFTALLGPINSKVVEPAVVQLLSGTLPLAGFQRTGAVISQAGGISLQLGSRLMGGFYGVAALLAGLVLLCVLYFLFTKFVKVKRVAPYSGGELTGHDGKGRDFIGPMDKVEHIRMHNYYFSGVFSEPKLVPAFSLISILLILIMFGVS